jgi:3-oxoacyl-[acyl-carrier protein] reductase
VGTHETGRKRFFFEKKNQKTFATWARLSGDSATASKKFFASFFQKRRPFFMRSLTCITGATKGVGRDIALALAQQGADIVIVGRDAAAAASAAAEISALGRQGIACLADLSVPGRFLEGLAAAGVAATDIDVLVCAAGLSLKHAPVWTYSDADYQLCFDLNVRGVLQAVNAVLPGMIARRQGRIVAIGGTYGHRGVAGSAIYAASKWALRGLIKSVAMDAGPYGVTANIVAPGGIDGENLRAQFAQSARREGLTEQAVHDRFAARSALRKLVTAQDVAGMVAFLVSDAGRHITGQDLLVDAGTIT